MSDDSEAQQALERYAQREKETEIINAAEESVKVLLRKLARLKAEKEAVISGLESQVIQLQEEIHDKSAPFDIPAMQIVEDIKKLMPVIARTFKTENGQVSYKKGYTRTSWDTKALDACIGHL